MNTWGVAGLLPCVCVLMHACVCVLLFTFERRSEAVSALIGAGLGLCVAAICSSEVNEKANTATDSDVPPL